MLQELYIRNYALIEELRLEFSPGLNIITGETGAGKSILIGALGQILGERASVDMIRSGAERCLVEGAFELEDTHPVVSVLKGYGIDLEDGRLILRRELSREGRGRCYVNDLPVTIRTLKSIGDLLVDQHGQHEHQSLLKVESHVDFLDRFGGIAELVEELGENYDKLVSLRTKLEKLRTDRAARQERKELYEFQLKEISDASSDLERIEELQQELSVLQNRERLAEDIAQVYNLLYGAEDSVADRLGIGARWLKDAVEVDSVLKEKLEAYNSLLYGVEDLGFFLRSYSQGLREDPQRLEELRERLAFLERLKKKYGGSVESVFERKAFLEKELSLSDDIDREIEEIEKNLHEVSERFSELCTGVSRRRRSAAEHLAEQVEKSLTELGMPDASFKVNFIEREDPSGNVEIDGRRFNAGPKGIEDIEFYISTNPGEEMKPLVKVASGGEISRIMLSLKSILADVDSIPTLIFDEIDIGISGRIAEAVGRKLKDLSQSHQTISITHLPQIAKMAQRHISVFKETEGGRSVTRAVPLEDDQRVRELAKLLGGEVITETTLEHAREMLGQGNAGA